MTHDPIYYYDPKTKEFIKQPVIVINMHQALIFFILGWVFSAILSTLLFILVV